MPPSLRHTAPLLLFALCLPVSAAGLGELRLHSGIGEPLLAEIEIQSGAGEALRTACFSLQPIRGSELPVLLAARVHLEQRGGRPLLTIVGQLPIDEPLLALRVEAACGARLQRDYILMPEVPSRATPSRSAPPARPRPAAIVPTATPAPRRPPPAPPPPQPSRPRPVERTVGDRLMLDTSPLFDLALPGTVQEETEARLLRLETDLEHLKQTLAGLERRVTGPHEASPERLHLARSLAQPAEAVPHPEQQSWQRWMELLFGTLLGGLAGVAALVWLDRRRQTGLSRSTN